MPRRPPPEVRVPGAPTVCDECQSTETLVLESRVEKGRIRRRRTCENGHRWNTYEVRIVDGCVLVSLPMSDLLHLYRIIGRINRGVGGATTIKPETEE